jgi:hypothetical protein
MSFEFKCTHPIEEGELIWIPTGATEIFVDSWNNLQQVIVRCLAGTIGVVETPKRMECLTVGNASKTLWRKSYLRIELGSQCATDFDRITEGQFMNDMFHITVRRLALSRMCRYMEVPRHSIDLKRGIDAATNTIVFWSLQGVINETHFVPTKIILNINTHVCKRRRFVQESKTAVTLGFPYIDNRCLEY